MVLFARNRLCALVKPGLKADSATLLERMLEPAVKLGISTPKADPSGDYAFEVFGKADAIKPGARAVLEGKALQLTGNATSATAPAGRAVYGWHVAEGRADIFLAYCTATREAKRQNPDEQIVELLAVGADYGLTVIKGASSPAQSFARFVMSPTAQKFLASQALHPARTERRHVTKLSARNQLKGKIVEVKRGATTAHVRIDIGGQVVIASITNESADELKLAAGQTAYAIVKASSVMVGVD